MAIAYYKPDKSNQIAISKKKYWLARFARIYPVYLLALLLIIAAKYNGLAENWETLPLHLFLLQSWIPGYPITLNTPGWSLSVEAFFYLCFPFLLIWVYKIGTKSLAIFTVILWLATQYILLTQLNSNEYAPKSHLHDLIYYNPLMHLNSFIAGMICGIYLNRKPNQVNKSSHNTLWLILSFGLIFLLIWSRPHLETLLGIKLAFTNGILAPAFLWFIVLLARNKGIITRILSSRWLVLLGEASYSLYILQKPIHGIYDKIIVPRITLSEMAHFYIFLVLLIIISILSYKYFETPLRKLLRQKNPKTSIL